MSSIVLREGPPAARPEQRGVWSGWLKVSLWVEDQTVDLHMWWPRLSRSTQEWLIANNGDAIPADIVQQISAAGGVVTSDAWWIGERQPDGFYLSDEATDWIEAVANSEATGVS